MPVLLIGEGPAVESAATVLEDADVAITRGSLSELPGADLAIVAGLAGRDGFGTANRLAAESDTPWIAVELGGVGGVPVESVSATVTALSPDAVCHDCLSARVAAGDPDAAPAASANRPDAHLAGSYAGSMALRALAGGEIAGQVIEVPHAERTVLPVPHCEHGSEPDHAVSLDVTDRSLEDALERAERAVDGRVGIVRQVGEQNSFPLPYYMAAIAETAEYSDASAPDHAAGVAATWDEAFMKALGEALERYSGAIYRTAEMERRAPSTLDPSVTEYVSVTEAQIDAVDETIPVVEGQNLHESTAVTLPADLVFHPAPEGRLGRQITTGLGLGSGGVQAVRSGLYETIERDATMLAWYSTFEALSLEVTDPTFETMADRARGSGLSVTPLLVTQDVDVPVVAVAVHRETYPKLALGSAADLDAEAAAVDALAEALQNWMELRDIGPEAAVEAEGEIGRYAREPGPATDLLDPTDSVPAAAVGPESVPDGRAELEAVLERLDDAGLEAVAADVTPRDVDSLGFTAVRVLTPGAQPLFVGEPVFGERAETVPSELGFESRLDRAYHPFP
jgi:ribosomal protein S12 methylthiotransferase accessory factor